MRGAALYSRGRYSTASLGSLRNTFVVDERPLGTNECCQTDHYTPPHDENTFPRVPKEAHRNVTHLAVYRNCLFHAAYMHACA
jgi:hypothetical protein